MLNQRLLAFTLCFLIGFTQSGWAKSKDCPNCQVQSDVKVNESKLGKLRKELMKLRLAANQLCGDEVDFTDCETEILSTSEKEVNRLLIESFIHLSTARKLGLISEEEFKAADEKFYKALKEAYPAGKGVYFDLGSSSLFTSSASSSILIFVLALATAETSRLVDIKLLTKIGLGGLVSGLSVGSAWSIHRAFANGPDGAERIGVGKSDIQKNLNYHEQSAEVAESLVKALSEEFTIPKNAELLLKRKIKDKLNEYVALKKEKPEEVQDQKLDILSMIKELKDESGHAILPKTYLDSFNESNKYYEDFKKTKPKKDVTYDQQTKLKIALEVLKFTSEQLDKSKLDVKKVKNDVGSNSNNQPKQERAAYAEILETFKTKLKLQKDDLELTLSLIDLKKED